MKNKPIKILAIETSCDETAAAVILEKNGKPEILSNIISSQADLHTKTGGVVPEVASRAHAEAIVPVVTEALLINSGKLEYQKAIKVLQNDITHIAVTNGPGLIGSLLIGFNAAKTIAYALDKPIIPINHIEGHIYSAIGQGKVEFPILALTVSGGHTSLTLMKDHGQYQIIGETLDDAAGEAFDKVARLLGLGYPGGPAISKLAEEFKGEKTFEFPRPILNNGTFNFSFSGLKTAVLQKVIDLKKEHGEKLPKQVKQEIAAAFEDAVVDVLVTKTIRAAEKFKPKAIILAGGVAANNLLRQTLELSTLNLKLATKFLVPPKIYCGDNAAMIGLAAFYHIQRGDYSTWDQVKVDSNLELAN